MITINDDVLKNIHVVHMIICIIMFTFQINNNSTISKRIDMIIKIYFMFCKYRKYYIMIMKKQTDNLTSLSVSIDANCTAVCCD